MNESTLLLQDQAYQQIKAAINEGEFNRDEIFSLNALAKKLNMSKTPVRDAVQRLSREGLLDILPSRGIRIAQYTPHEIVELFQTRFVITDFCCTMLALRHKENPDHPIFHSREEALQEQEQITDGDFGKFFDRSFQCYVLTGSPRVNHVIILEEIALLPILDRRDQMQHIKSTLIIFV